MSPERKRLLLLTCLVLVLAGVALAITWHLVMSDRDQISAGDVKVADPVQQTQGGSSGFPPPRAPVAPPSDDIIFSSVSQGSVMIRWEHAPGASATTPYKQVPPPSNHDAATNADFTLVDGSVPQGPDPLPLLHDGKMPPNADERYANFRLAIGTGEGRVKIDLHKPIRIAQINSYSWHTDIRGPQVYTVYGSNGSESGFNPAPRVGIDPAAYGWKKIADVDTRPASGFVGGRYAVSISDSSGSLGSYQYLLFCMQPASEIDGMGHTFYSEIDVVE